MMVEQQEQRIVILLNKPMNKRLERSKVKKEG